MRSASLAIIAAAALALPAQAQPPRQQRAADAATVAALPATGKPRSCLNLRDVRQTKAVGDRIILFRTGANRWYRSDLRQSCRMDSSDAFVFRTTIGQLCDIDVIDVVDPVSRINRGFCNLGKFTPVQLPKGLKL